MSGVRRTDFRRSRTMMRILDAICFLAVELGEPGTRLLLDRKMSSAAFRTVNMAEVCANCIESGPCRRHIA